MAEIKEIAKSVTFQEVGRTYEQPSDAISFYCDFAQVIYTGHEIVVQLYETIPGPPLPSGQISKVITRLRATVTLGSLHAQNLGKMLVERGAEVQIKGQVK
jgi:hypothetical protein